MTWSCAAAGSGTASCGNSRGPEDLTFLPSPWQQDQSKGPGIQQVLNTYLGKREMRPTLLWELPAPPHPCVLPASPGKLRAEQILGARPGASGITVPSWRLCPALPEDSGRALRRGPSRSCGLGGWRPRVRPAGELGGDQAARNPAALQGGATGLPLPGGRPASAPPISAPWGLGAQTRDWRPRRGGSPEPLPRPGPGARSPRRSLEPGRPGLCKQLFKALFQFSAQRGCLFQARCLL